MIAPVSVIIPCYRCARSIERAVASVSSQTVRPIELLLIDDGSDDETLATLFELQEVYGREWTSVIPLKRNSGPSSARNAGWKKAKGEFVAFLDADDAWHTKKIEIQHGWMSTHPNFTLTGHRCATISGNSSFAFSNKQFRVYKVGPFPMLFVNVILTRSVMIRRDVPYRFQAGKKYSEDYLLWLEILLNGHLAAILDIPLGYSFKAPYGVAGLTQNLAKMEEGELDTFRSLYRKGLLSAPLTCMACGFSVFKYIRRLMIISLKKFRQKIPMTNRS